MFTDFRNRNYWILFIYVRYISSHLFPEHFVRRSHTRIDLSELKLCKKSTPVCGSRCLADYSCSSNFVVSILVTAPNFIKFYKLRLLTKTIPGRRSILSYLGATATFCNCSRRIFLLNVRDVELLRFTPTICPTQESLRVPHLPVRLYRFQARARVGNSNT